MLQVTSKADTLLAMGLRAVQICQPEMVDIAVESNSTPGKTYTVLVTDVYDPSDILCECEGFIFRGYCSHQMEAYNQCCRWNSLIGPEVQTPEEHRDKICPRCGRTTEWTMAETSEDE